MAYAARHDASASCASQDGMLPGIVYTFSGLHMCYSETRGQLVSCRRQGTDGGLGQEMLEEEAGGGQG